MTVAGLLAFSSYVNVAGYAIDGAGMTAAWSGIYVLLAARRRPQAVLSQSSLGARFSSRAVVRAAAMGLGTVNCAAGYYAYATGDRAAEAASGGRERWIKK